MELIKEKWKKEDSVLFNNYLKNLENIEKVEWTKKIINTNMKVLAIKTAVIKEIAKNINKGNSLSFLDLELDRFYENMSLNAILISKIKDFDEKKKYLDKYVLKIDNWAACDILSFDVKNKEKEHYNLSLEYIKSDRPFVRRVGLLILFSFIKNDEYIEKIFEILNSFYEENHYYVNMMIAWLFCECFIKRREETREFLKTHKLNKFTINKGISKCRDSYRVAKNDKEMLIKYRVK